jgi:hypothetical protein
VRVAVDGGVAEARLLAVIVAEPVMTLPVADAVINALDVATPESVASDVTLALAQALADERAESVPVLVDDNDDDAIADAVSTSVDTIVRVPSPLLDLVAQPLTERKNETLARELAVTVFSLVTDVLTRHVALATALAVELAVARGDALDIEDPLGLPESVP